MNHLTLLWGTEKIPIALPDSWRAANVLEPSPLPSAKDPAEAIRCSLHSPIGSAPLVDLAQPNMKIAIVIDDASRPTSIAAILPRVLAELDRAGARRETITLVTALGVHRSMTQSEIEQRAGAMNLAGRRRPRSRRRNA